MAYDEYLEKMSRYFSKIISSSAFFLCGEFDIALIFMLTIGVVSGAIMLLYRLLQIWYALATSLLFQT